MPKLSALSSSSTVKLKIFDTTYTLNWLAYNHYGKSEVTLFLSKWLPRVLITTRDDGVTGYLGGILDASLTLDLIPLLPETIRGSLTYVSISDTTRTADRAVFLPSTTEVGMNTIIQTTKGSIEYTTCGSAFSTLSSLVTGHGEAALRGKTSGTLDFSGGNAGTYNLSGARPTLLKNIHYTGDYDGIKRVFIYDSSSGNIASAPKTWPNYMDDISYSQTHVQSGPVFADASLWGLAPATAASYILVNTHYHRNILITLNGNCEVTLSGGAYNITKPTAIESYRKIDGVWYRTT